MLLPSALGFSPHPPVSVYGTGMVKTIAAFLGTWLMYFPTFVRSTLRLWIATGFYRCDSSSACAGFLIPGLHFPHASPQFLFYHSTGISTCCPSATLLRLALGPDLPRADQLYPGILGYSAGRILTFLSLLIPAFSLPDPPRLLSVPLPQIGNAPLPKKDLSFFPELRWRVSAPDIFGAEPLD